MACKLQCLLSLANSAQLETYLTTGCEPREEARARPLHDTLVLMPRGGAQGAVGQLPARHLHCRLYHPAATQQTQIVTRTLRVEEECCSLRGVKGFGLKAAKLCMRSTWLVVSTGALGCRQLHERSCRADHQASYVAASCAVKQLGIPSHQREAKEQVEQSLACSAQSGKQKVSSQSLLALLWLSAA